MRNAILLAALLLAGCTLTKDPEVVGGNKLTGMVRLGFSDPALFDAKADPYLAQATATRQFQEWGFATAEGYGQPIKTCSVISGTQCLNESVILKYQCRGFAIPHHSGW
ncbi:MAG TPA: hypothetical protein DCY50_03220 [Franconibacter helveticus]|nr:hypothetical protein [Franconibacter helveticus]